MSIRIDDESTTRYDNAFVMCSSANPPKTKQEEERVSQGKEELVIILFGTLSVLREDGGEIGVPESFA